MKERTIPKPSQPLYRVIDPDHTMHGMTGRMLSETATHRELKMTATDAIVTFRHRQVSREQAGAISRRLALQRLRKGTTT